MTEHHQERTLSTQVGILISLVPPALLALWMLWIWLGHSPVGSLGLLHSSLW
jgi:hypothetical protein